MGATTGKLTGGQPTIARLFHWVNIISLFGTIASGLQIYNANPRINQRTQVGQRVEQHVRLQLALQQLQARLAGMLVCLAHLADEISALAAGVKQIGARNAGQRGDQ